MGQSTKEFIDNEFPVSMSDLLTKNAHSDTFKAPCCCFEYNMHLALHLLLFVQSM